MIIPHQEIQPETLTKLIQEFVLREGTDYGLEDVELTQKIAQVRQQLASGEAVIVYSELYETVNIIPHTEVEQYLSASE
ncbi:YheU family protein [Thalassotalea euphylliae]|uniref:YheU family protein n=1 Tax=Thalassotalea euphylliae TaxID=1655234 RepID=A0A3E0U3U2_9GAMM|nr:YheU family protein [Thalassotalea euphylliae]REL31596.1 YheU family protein [Thalassotalea euphylliae]